MVKSWTKIFPSHHVLITNIAYNYTRLERRKLSTDEVLLIMCSVEQFGL